MQRNSGGTDAVFFAEARQSESVATFPSINSAFSPLYEILKTRPATTSLLFGLITLLCADWSSIGYFLRWLIRGRTNGVPPFSLWNFHTDVEELYSHLEK